MRLTAWLLSNNIVASFLLSSSLLKRCLSCCDPTGWNVNIAQYLRYFSYMWPTHTFWKFHLTFISCLSTVCQALFDYGSANSWVELFSLIFIQICWHHLSPNVICNSMTFFFFLLDLVSDILKHLFHFPMVYYPI